MQNVLGTNIKITIFDSNSQVKFSLDSRNSKQGTFPFSLSFTRTASYMSQVPSLTISNLSPSFFEKDQLYIRRGNNDKIKIEAGYVQMGTLIEGVIGSYYIDFNGLGYDLTILFVEGANLLLFNSSYYDIPLNQTLVNTSLKELLETAYSPFGGVLFYTNNEVLSKPIGKFTLGKIAETIDKLIFENELQYFYFNTDLIVWDFENNQEVIDLENYLSSGTICKDLGTMSSINQRNPQLFSEKGDEIYIAWEINTLLVPALLPSQKVRFTNSLGDKVEGYIGTINYSLEQFDYNMNLIVVEKRKVS